MKICNTFVSLLLLAAAAPGQGVATPSATPAPTFLGNYSVTLQQFVPAPPPLAAPLLVYDNAVFNGSFFPSGSGIANMDWGTLSASGHNSITLMQIGYATSEPDPFQSGIVDLIVSLHEAATGSGDDGTTISTFLLTGLPGSQSGSPEAFTLDVTLPGPVSLPDGPIGYSYEPLDETTGPLLTGPAVEAGVIDLFDEYQGTGGPLIGSFNFGAGAPIASFWCQLTGDETECFLVFGNDDDTQSFTPLGHTFTTQVGTVQDFYAVLLDDIPGFNLPQGRSMFGVGGAQGGSGQTQSPDWMADGRFTVQVVMWNPAVFPGQPEQFTSGMRVRLMPDGTVKTRAFGPSIGMDIWADVSVNAEGKKVLSFPFSIDGL